MSAAAAYVALVLVGTIGFVGALEVFPRPSQQLLIKIGYWIAMLAPLAAIVRIYGHDAVILARRLIQGIKGD